MTTKNTSGGSDVFLSLLTVLFIGLKLTGYIAWPWLPQMTFLQSVYFFFAACMFLAAYDLAGDRSFRCFAVCLWMGFMWPIIVVVTAFKRIIRHD